MIDQIILRASAPPRSTVSLYNCLSPSNLVLHPAGVKDILQSGWNVVPDQHALPRTSNTIPSLPETLCPRPKQRDLTELLNSNHSSPSPSQQLKTFSSSKTSPSPIQKSTLTTSSCPNPYPHKSPSQEISSTDAAPRKPPISIFQTLSDDDSPPLPSSVRDTGLPSPPKIRLHPTGKRMISPRGIRK